MADSIKPEDSLISNMVFNSHRHNALLIKVLNLAAVFLFCNCESENFANFKGL